jgi:catechol 2,3-dioxygenase-like lactoylglutathione lyase family enzyme
MWAREPTGVVFDPMTAREQGGAVEVLSSRVLLRPTDFERSFRFYEGTLGLHIYREYGEGDSRGVVFFLGGGFLEVSGSGGHATTERMALWLQVPDLSEAEGSLRESGVEIEQPARLMPWGLRELWARDPDGVKLVFVEVPEEHPLRRRTS